MLSMFASTPWLQFNPLSLTNADRGRLLRLTWGICGDEIDRVTGCWVDQLMSCGNRALIKPKIDRTFPFDPSRRRQSFHSGPQERGERAAHPLTESSRTAGEQKRIETHADRRGGAWEEVSNGEARARFHRTCHAEWRTEREAAARQALGLEG